MKAAPPGHVLEGRQAPSANRQIFNAAALIAVLTFVVKLAAMGKEMVGAAFFGTGDAMDAFVMALLLPSYVINVVAGSFNAALIPIQIETRERLGPPAARRLFRSVSILGCVSLLLIMLLLAAASPFLLPVLCSGFGPEKLALASRLFYLLLPIIALCGMITQWEALLNASERFAMAAFAPAALSLVTLGMLWWKGGRWGIYAMVAGTLVGLVFQLVLLGFAAKRLGLAGALLPWWHGMEPNVRRVIGQYLPMIAGSVLFCSSILVDQTMAGMLAAGSVATLNYGNKLVALAVGIGTTALGTAVLPHFSRMTANRDWPGVRHTLKTYTWIILLVTVPATAVAIWGSTPLATLLYERGNFTREDTLAVSWVQQMFFLQIPFYSLSLLYVRMISSLKGNRIVMAGAFAGFCLNVGLNLCLMKPMGVAGIALSTSFVYLFMTLAMGGMLWRKLAQVEKGGDE